MAQAPENVLWFSYLFFISLYFCSTFWESLISFSSSAIQLIYFCYEIFNFQGVFLVLWMFLFFLSVLFTFFFNNGCKISMNSWVYFYFVSIALAHNILTFASRVSPPRLVVACGFLQGPTYQLAVNVEWWDPGKPVDSPACFRSSHFDVGTATHQGLCHFSQVGPFPHRGAPQPPPWKGTPGARVWELSGQSRVHMDISLLSVVSLLIFF